MNKKQKNNLIIAVFVLAFLLLIRKSKNEEQETSFDELTKQVNEPKEIAIKKEPYLYDWLQLGSKGEVVKRLQMRLNYIYNDISKFKNNYSKFSLASTQEKRDILRVNDRTYNGKKLFPLKVDGIFGKRTKWAVYEVADVSTRDAQIGTNLYLTRRDHWLWLDYLNKIGS
jgi:peptidoglycan hydrolase-like protein with peptidoglycan-binding domain